jgi:hypothetical protein
MPSEFSSSDVLIKPFGYIFNFYLVRICRVRDLEQFYLYFEKLGKLIGSEKPTPVNAYSSSVLRELLNSLPLGNFLPPT